MRIDANIIVFLDDAHEQFQDLPLKEKAMASIILGVTDRGTPMERTHIYKSRTTAAGVCYDNWQTVLCGILEGTEFPIRLSEKEYQRRITEHLQSPQG